MPEQQAGGFLNRVNKALVPFIEIVKSPLDFSEIINRHYGWVDIQRVQNWTAKFFLTFASNDLDEASRGEFFDEWRADLKKTILFQFSNSVPKKVISSECLEAMTRQTYAQTSRGLLRLSAKNSDERVRQTYKGVAWSVLVKDADDVLSRNSNYSINPEWKTSLWRLINVKNPDMGMINTEIDKFTSKDPGVFLAKS